MVVPGALLRRITEKKMELELQPVPETLQAREGEPILVEVVVQNRGNQVGVCRLDARLDTDTKIQSVSETLAPGERKTLQFRFATLSNGRAAAPTYVELQFSHQTIEGGWTVPRRAEIRLQIETRKDVVGIQFAGLDELDDL
jgi:uncharacterized protein (DUF58 family)